MKRLSAALVIFTIMLGSSKGVGIGKNSQVGAIVVLNRYGERVPSGRPNHSSQLFDVAVGSGGFVFSPDTVNIHAGDTVRWTWASSGHSVTSGDNCSTDSKFCSPNDMNCGAGTLSGTGTVYEYTFNAAGSYTYFCAAHCALGMVGTVNVVAPLQLVSAVSRKSHGGVTFDLPLPLSGEPAVECRNGAGNHTLVFTFTNDVTTGSAGVTTGTGGVSGTPTFATNTMTVNLTGVANVQKITVTLSGMMDTFGQTMPNTAVSINMLIGDTTGNKSVNSSDVSQTKSQSGSPVTSTNFREDVTVNGVINSSDVSLVKSRSGTGL